MLDTILKEIKYVNQTVINTSAGTAPKLPDTVTAVFNDGTSEEVDVIWSDINPLEYSKAGSFTVKGIVNGTEIIPKASITVIEGSGPVLSFSVISDIHCDSDISSGNNKKFKDALIDLNEVNRKAEALCVVGDMTERGYDDQYDVFMQILDSVPHPKPYFVMGNHDVRWHDGGYEETYNRFLTKTKMPGAYYNENICGFHFIFMSTDQDLKDQAYISEAQLDWLSTKLSEGASSNKPTFVFLHQSLASTSAGSYPEHGYGTSGYPDGVVQDSQLRSILAQYPQCIFITGHTHMIMEHPKTVIHTSGFWCVNTASVSYTLSVDGYGLDYGSQGVCFDVYPNKVVIKGRDFGKKEWVLGGQWDIAF
jgi:3',5'-cyclic-AMP phosphodiesterase